MFHASDLKGRSVVDLDAGETLGRVEDLILDPDGQRLAGLIITTGRTILDPGRELLVPAAAIHAIGPDALTVRAWEAGDADTLGSLPRLGDVRGKHVVTQSGETVGTLSDVMLEPASGQVLGYGLRPSGASGEIGEQLE